MTKQQVLTKLNERLAKKDYKATIVRFDNEIKHCEILITTKHHYIVATMGMSIEVNDSFCIYQACIMGLPNQFVDAYNLIEKGENKWKSIFTSKMNVTKI